MKEAGFIFRTKRYALINVLDFFVNKSKKKTTVSFFEDFGLVDEDAEDIISISAFDKWRRGEVFPSKDKMEILKGNLPEFEDKYNKVYNFLYSSEEWKRYLEEEWKKHFIGTPMEQYISEDEVWQKVEEWDLIALYLEDKQKKEAIGFYNENIKILNKEKENYALQKKISEYLKP